METGEFEYVKPPHFYIDQASKDTDVDIPQFSTGRRKVEGSNPLINGVRPNTPEPEEGTVEIDIDDEKTSTKKIVVKVKSEKTLRGRTPKLCGQEDEIAKKYEEGLNLQKLSEMYGVSMPCISNAIRRAGVEIRTRGNRKGKHL